MDSAIEKAFEEDSEIIIEKAIEGVEVSVGVYNNQEKVIVLPITEIVPETAFFDYEAKYLGKSNEITPAEIPKQLTLQIQNIATEVYDILRCNGMIRIDFLLNEKGPYLIEVNTVPGFSEASLIPQQAAAAGISKKELISLLLE